MDRKGIVFEIENELTVASFWTSSSDAPKDANPISCENWANLGSASSGTCPRSSWHVSLTGKTSEKNMI